MTDIDTAHQTVFLYLLGNKYKKEYLIAPAQEYSDKAWGMQWDLRTQSSTHIDWIKVWKAAGADV
ncbi:hypothetical protein AVU12_gp034 [Pseudomonas phage KPP21]|uniref:Uncharacterized protein n=2 Tax=Luzseptimavirus KPP21 TaxID=1982595 RepID=A0A7S5W9A8_9CAUD|nr:hypothetical protein AVU12_gp034 [Pseudomonas phage KPP21]QKE55998.1 hypothetical protein AMP2_gp050 [Pseudomonas phage vB_Pae_AM.P2]BAR94593.1 hypothetical protein [Pseudomonas phage KPP21]